MKNTFTILFTLTLMVAACGRSPLLHHLQATERGASVSADAATALNPAPNLSAENCPLYFEKSQLCASISWRGEVTDQGENSFELKFWSSTEGTKDGPYTDFDGTAAVQLWMPSMGHGSSPVTVTSVARGHYSVTRVYFIMPGDWDVRVQIKKNGQVFEQTVLHILL